MREQARRLRILGSTGALDLLFLNHPHPAIGLDTFWLANVPGQHHSHICKRTAAIMAHFIAHTHTTAPDGEGGRLPSTRFSRRGPGVGYRTLLPGPHHRREESRSDADGRRVGPQGRHLDGQLTAGQRQGGAACVWQTPRGRSGRRFRLATAEICACIWERSKEATVCWVPAHHGVAGNEKAGECAKAAAEGGSPRTACRRPASHT